MQLRKLLQDDDAVSPVIGVILMVAITVILAAVIASFVLGLGSDDEVTPNPAFNWEVENTSASNEYNVTIEVTGGDEFETNKIDIQVDEGFNSGGGAWNTYPSSDTVKWKDYPTWDGSDKASAGDEVIVPVNDESEWDIKIVWSDDTDTNNEIIGEKTG